MNRPSEYVTRGPEERIRFGDIWLRPCDSTWVEVGTAMVGLLVGNNAIACRWSAAQNEQNARGFRYHACQMRFDKLRLTV